MLVQRFGGGFVTDDSERSYRLRATRETVSGMNPATPVVLFARDLVTDDSVQVWITPTDAMLLVRQILTALEPFEATVATEVTHRVDVR